MPWVGLLSPQSIFHPGLSTFWGSLQASLPHGASWLSAREDLPQMLGSHQARNSRDPQSLGLPCRAGNPACRSGSGCFLAQPRNPCRVKMVGTRASGVGTHEVQTEGLVGWREEREAQFSGLGLPRKPRGPGSTGQEPSRPRPDPKVARAWSCKYLLFLPQHPAPQTCPSWPWPQGKVPG